LTNPPQQFVRTISTITEARRFGGRRAALNHYLNALRPAHWLKNCLVFLPLLEGHRFNEPRLLTKASLAFVALCLCASSGYLVNDLFDLSADRVHPQKRQRPYASGLLPVSHVATMITFLVLLGCGLGIWVSTIFFGILLLYFTLTFTYSIYLKTFVLLDVIVLASLYTLRILAGSAVLGVWPSEWLLAFFMLLFLSLALVKRYDELVVMRSVEGDRAKARSYVVSDAELLASNGAASGFLAVMVLALYINTGTAHLHGRHELMWLLCPSLLYWLGYVWLMAHRGRMREDPVVFALHDRTSRNLMLLMLVTALVAA
jgi:4-hydroxybenzoate polyprenyltransferase